MCQIWLELVCARHHQSRQCSCASELRSLWFIIVRTSVSHIGGVVVTKGFFAVGLLIVGIGIFQTRGGLGSARFPSSWRVAFAQDHFPTWSGAGDMFFRTSSLDGVYTRVYSLGKLDFSEGICSPWIFFFARRLGFVGIVPCIA
eukprot:TRINITY_DN21644_c0_g2_i1.p2 TRINITY_DN21644_c0_g2~~TRINITY_DN21644_c0_g2_i1.p2  ORF type:complete len:144 (+),score=12.57 TRINITY_DN21644_c0_g2_i1:307-738(+)